MKGSGENCYILRSFFGDRMGDPVQDLGAMKQIVVAVAQGSMAAMTAFEEIQGLFKKELAKT